MKENEKLPELPEEVEAFIGKNIKRGYFSNAVRQLVPIFSRVTGCPPKLWIDDMIGFDRYPYRQKADEIVDAPMLAMHVRDDKLVLFIIEARVGYGRHVKDSKCPILYPNSMAWSEGWEMNYEAIEKIAERTVIYYRRYYNVETYHLPFDI